MMTNTLTRDAIFVEDMYDGFEILEEKERSKVRKALDTACDLILEYEEPGNMLLDGIKRCMGGQIEIVAAYAGYVMVFNNQMTRLGKTIYRKIEEAEVTVWK